MYSIKAILDKQPAVIAGAVKSILFVLVLMSVVVIDEKVLAGVALALELVLGLFVVGKVTPTAAPKLDEGTPVEVVTEGDAPNRTVTL